MVQLVSRPIPSRPFDYRFDCVLGGHPLDDEVAAALAEMQVETARLRVFGSYRADRDEGWETVAATKCGGCPSGMPGPVAPEACSGRGCWPGGYAAAVSAAGR